MQVKTKKIETEKDLRLNEKTTEKKVVFFNPKLNVGQSRNLDC